MKGLQVSEQLNLPLEAVTHKTAILGMTGSGKSWCMTKLAELFLDARAQVVILDPKGEAWGLRLMADGKMPAYPIPVFGGDHADMPLRPDMGRRIAELIVEGDYSAVLDVSEFISSELALFSYDFATRLFEMKKRKPGAMSLMIDEAQEFVPQNPTEKGMELKMLHAFERVAKQLRSKGVGMVICGQRPQEINKKVLNMCEVWFAFQMTGEQERDTMEKIFTVLDKNEARRLKALLPSLEVGVAHIWSPRLLKVAAEYPIGMKKTFDTSSTPAVGARQVVPRKLAPVDAAALEAALSDIIEEEQANNPEALHEKIRELRAHIAVEADREAKLVTSLEKMAKKPAAAGKVVTVEKAVLKSGQITRLEKLADRLRQEGTLATNRQVAILETQAAEAERHFNAMKLFWDNFDGRVQSLADILRALVGNGSAPLTAPIYDMVESATIDADAGSGWHPSVTSGLRPGASAKVIGRIGNDDGEYDMADFEEFYQKTVQRLKQDGFAVTVKLEPKEFVLKQFQQAEVGRLLEQTAGLSTFQKQALKWCESKGVRVAKADILKAITGKSPETTSGSVRADRYKEIDELVVAGFINKAANNSLASNITTIVKTRLALHNASEREIEEVSGQVVMQLE